MKVGIFGQKNNKTTLKYIHTLVELLIKYDTKIVFEENIFEYFSKKFPGYAFDTFKDYYDLDSTYDMFYSVGGDGTFLRSITFIRDHNIPIIGINTGRLGFLATVQKEQIVEAIYQINQGQYKIKERSVLELQTNDQNPDLQEINIALNEIAITRKNTASMITVETYLDDEFLTTYWSDGLIISTPTGSTGYSLSCGGPIISPSSKNIVLTPIAPHSLSVRPLVIPESTKIELHIGSRSKEAVLSMDSRMTTISNTTKIMISKADFTVKTLHLNSQTFIKTLREKLLWGEDKRN
ncbi:NAD kinase [Namhaeicola litoreus]|uniref:NAD kinase n=1 Tax=Namhaeicola litoreus TaxID=1052145 RepID=A0ABW3XY56_9FLAO